jgi:hypothetical protein
MISAYFFFSWPPSNVDTCARISPSCVTYASAPRYGAARKSAFARHWTFTVSPTTRTCSDSNVNPHSPPSLSGFTNPSKSSPTSRRPCTTWPPGKKNSTSGGYWAISRVQSQRFSASRCSSTTAFGVACRFSEGNKLPDVTCRVPCTPVRANASAMQTPKRTLTRMHTLWRMFINPGYDPPRNVSPFRAK